MLSVLPVLSIPFCNKKSLSFVCVSVEDCSWPIIGVVTAFINQFHKNLVLMRSSLFKCYPLSKCHIVDAVLIKSNKRALLPGAEPCDDIDKPILHTTRFVPIPKEHKSDCLAFSLSLSLSPCLSFSLPLSLLTYQLCQCWSMTALSCPFAVYQRGNSTLHPHTRIVLKATTNFQPYHF